MGNLLPVSSPDMRLIETSLKQKGITNQALDHFAVIDLPGPESGIKQLRQNFHRYRIYGTR